MFRLRFSSSLLTLAIAIACSAPTYVIAQSKLAEVQIADAKLEVEGQTVLIHLQSSFKEKSVELPRLAAPVRSIQWRGQEGPSNIKLQPELTSWKLAWDAAPTSNATIEIHLDAPPLLIEECKPIEASGDGSLFLPAHFATTAGDKIRYEPQPFKNTVGYWAGLENTATWNLNIVKPGKFNVAILQGCGSDNGGGTAEVTLSRVGSSNEAVASIEFEVQETGHFQNFIWRHLGEVSLKEAGEYQLRIRPKNLKRAALMDVRAVHLIRLP